MMKRSRPRFLSPRQRQDKDNDKDKGKSKDKDKDKDKLFSHGIRRLLGLSTPTCLVLSGLVLSCLVL